MLKIHRVMFLNSILKSFFMTSSCSAAISEDAGRSLKAFNVDAENMMVFGSGCPEGNVNMISSTDGKTVTVLFSNYCAQTTDSRMFDRKSCNIAVPFDIDPNKQIALFQIDYRGTCNWINHRVLCSKSLQFFLHCALQPEIRLCLGS